MKCRNPGYVPRLDTQAGACLTAANWQEAGVSAVSCSLAALMIKPGLSVLKQLDDLAGYWGWSGSMILNAQMPALNKEGLYNLQSPYDGSRQKISPQEVLDLVCQLQPDQVLLPVGILQLCPDLAVRLPPQTQPFFAAADVSRIQMNSAYGIYFSAKEAAGKSDDSAIPFVVCGEMSRQELQRWLKSPAVFVEADTPAQDAYQGLFYRKEAVFDLTVQNVGLPLSEDCPCPVCQQGLSPAYLQHLFTQTPLLCHRYLIQHNASFIQAEWLKK